MGNYTNKCTEEAMNLYSKAIWNALAERLNGHIKVDLDPERDTMHIYTCCKGRRFDWQRTKASELIILGVPAEIVAAEYTDKYNDYIKDLFFKPGGDRTVHVWNGYLQKIRGGQAV